MTVRPNLLRIAVREAEAAILCSRSPVIRAGQCVVRATVDISGILAREMGYASASGVGRAVKRMQADNRELNKSVERIEQKLTNG